jgi:hypothetical protein
MAHWAFSGAVTTATGTFLFMRAAAMAAPKSICFALFAELPASTVSVDSMKTRGWVWAHATDEISNTNAASACFMGSAPSCV